MSRWENGHTIADYSDHMRHGPAAQPPSTWPSPSPCHGPSLTPGSWYPLCQGPGTQQSPARASSTASLGLQLHHSHLTLGHCSHHCSSKAATAPAEPRAANRCSHCSHCPVCPEPRCSQPKLTPPSKHKGGRCFTHALTLTYLMYLKTSRCLKAFWYNGNCTIGNTRNKTSWNS